MTDALEPSPLATLRLEFCGEWFDLSPEEPFTIGRDADLVVDDNPYLHRRFLEIRHHEGMWWLSNLGGQLSATTSEGEGRFQGWLAPGARLPIIFEVMHVRFTAGPTAYEVALHLGQPPFSPGVHASAEVGDTTLGRVLLTHDQKLLVLALAEPALRAETAGRAHVPSSAEAAARLGWAITKYNRKLDNVCQKLKNAGIRGLHGGPDRLASDRRGRLVEYAIAVRLVTRDDLELLDGDLGDGELGDSSG
jgi:hypothetical protein